MDTPKLARVGPPVGLSPWLARTGVVAGLFVLGLSGVWLASPVATVSPLAGQYADNAVLALEFARTPEALAVVIGDDPPTASAVAVRAALDQLNRWDFVYMLGYGLLLSLGGLHQAQRLQVARGVWLVPLVVFAVVCDVWENWLLLSLTTTGADVPAILPWLMVATYLKWELLVVVNVVYAWMLWRGGGVLGRGAAVVGALALPLGVLAVVEPATYAPLLTVAFTPVWLAAFVGCARDSR